MRKILSAALLLSASIFASGQTAAYEYRYWFDSNHSGVKTGTSDQKTWSMKLDADSLSYNLHTLNFQVKDTSGSWSSPVSKMFVKMSTAETVGCSYWFDNDSENRRDIKVNGGAVMLDASKLPIGLHTINVRSTGGVQSSPQSRMFVKTTTAAQISGYYYWFNNDFENKQSISVNNGVTLIDATALPNGLHTLNVLAEGEVMSSPQSKMFIKTMLRPEKQSLMYKIDNGEDYIMAGALEGGTYHFDLDLSALQDGLHRLTCVMVDENSETSNIVSKFFVKTAMGGNGIVRYDYWLNDSIECIKTVEVSERVNPYRLVDVLKISEQAIRSMDYHFEVDGEVPMVYAKNNLHVVFRDARNQITEAVESFVDYSVADTLSNIVYLTEKRGDTIFAKPAQNKIEWFAIRAAVGDSIALNTNQLCYMEVYSPTGEKVYSADETSSKIANGFRTEHTGTYYIALHDVNSSSSNVTLSYYHEFYDNYIQDIILDKTSIEGFVGEEVRLTATIVPDNATNVEIVWSSDNEAVATVSESGLVTLVAKGSATITATAADGSGVTATCAVTVKEELGVDAITVNAEVKAVNGEIVISGIADDVIVKIYDISGQFLYAGTNRRIALTEHNVYFVKIAGTTFKVVL